MTRGGLLQQPRNQQGPPAAEAALDCGSRAAAFQETGQGKAGAALPLSKGCRLQAVSEGCVWARERVPRPWAGRACRLGSPAALRLHVLVVPGLLEMRLLTPRCANGQKVAGASDASAAVADGRFLVRPQTHSEVEFLNSPVLFSSWDSDVPNGHELPGSSRRCRSSEGQTGVPPVSQ